jgi:hypothetical protein
MRSAPALGAAEKLHQRRYQDQADDRGVDDDGRGHPDPQQLEKHLVGDQEGEDDAHHRQAPRRQLSVIHEGGREPAHLGLEPLAELMRSAATGLAVWWGEHPEVPQTTIVNVTVDLLAHGLRLTKPGNNRD